MSIDTKRVVESKEGKKAEELYAQVGDFLNPITTTIRADFANFGTTQQEVLYLSS